MKILIADDEQLLVEFLERSLRLSKHVVDIARDGKETLEKARNNTYDAIILDIIMPKKNGIEVCKELREEKNHTPILILTSREGEQATIEGLDSGADDYISKPFKFKELEARLRAITRRPHQRKPDIISVGDLKLDNSKKLISLNEKPVTLRPKEYALLEYLIKNTGKVIPKEELLENVWLISATNASNRLEVCMYHIRGKINKKQKLLKTVRGYGYVIEA